MRQPSGSHELLPFWIRVFSWIFLGALFTPFIAIGHVVGGVSVSMLDMSLDVTTGPLVWVTTEVLLFAAGVTALAILMRWKWAYDFGVVFASASILIGALGLLAGIGGVRDNLQSATVQHVAFAVFLVHLIRHRADWKDQAPGNPPRPARGGSARPV